MQRIGFIGLGLMGQGMARNLLAAGYSLTVWNRTAHKCEQLVAAGARQAESPAEVAAGSDVVITIVSDTPDVEEVVLGESGILSQAREGLVLIDMSTISPSATRSMAERLGAAGIDMLDAPVSGGTEGADRGTLSIMVGGKPSVFDMCLPILEVMGDKIIHIGDSGAGQTTKLVNQILVVVNALAMSEALTFAAKAGLDLDRVHQAVSAGAGGSWMLSNRGPQILAGDFSPGFTVRLQQKDVRLALAAAAELGAPLLGTGLVHQLYATLEARGLEGEGNHALVRAIEALAGIEARAGGGQDRS